MSSKNTRPATDYIHANGAVVVVPARVAAYLNRWAGLEAYRLHNGGADPQVDQVLLAFRIAEMEWKRSVSGTTRAATPELDSSLEWMSTKQVSERLLISDRAIRKAIAEKRLAAESVAGRWRISKEAFEHYKAARAN